MKIRCLGVGIWVVYGWRLGLVLGMVGRKFYVGDVKVCSMGFVF